MSQKIISNLLRYADRCQARNLVIMSDAERINCHYHLPAGAVTTLSLPKKLEQDFLTDLRRLLAVAPHELIQKKYCKLNTKHCRLTFYLTILPHEDGEKFIISIIGRNHQLWRLNQLGLERHDLHLIKTALHYRSGLIIVSSPPGNGKSSTLRALSAALNKPELNIYELTKEPEEEIPGINVLAPTNANWEKVLQHDSDVIIVADLDTDDSLAKAWRAANTGRLVIGALTAASAREVLVKIKKTRLGQGKLPEKSGDLKMIINQRLVDLKRRKNKNTKDQRQKIGRFEILELK